MKQILSILVILASAAFGHGTGAHHHTEVPRSARTPAAAHHRVARSSCPAMPTAAPAGYRTVVRDDFSGRSLDARTWYRWSGEPGSDPFGWWRTPLGVAGRGALRLRGIWASAGANPSWRAGGEVTSGIGSRHAQLYGEYQWCMKVDRMPGTSTIALLWPAPDRWPPEIDLFETKGATDGYSVSVHYGTARQNRIVRANVTHQDATRWNVYTAIWKPRFLRILENARVVATIAGNAHVPAVPMRFDLQTQAVRPHATRGATTVDWVVEYAPTR